MNKFKLENGGLLNVKLLIKWRNGVAITRFDVRHET